MAQIRLQTKLGAPIEQCFDLSRDIDLHMKSMKHTAEKVIDGVSSGLIGHNETVTWEAKHFGIKMNLKVAITEFLPPFYFKDEMQEGRFKYFSHEHHFEQHKHFVRMIDVLKYECPYGIFGEMFDKLYLKSYLTNLLKKRNAHIKAACKQEDKNIPQQILS